jgi:hypothetical protein
MMTKFSVLTAVAVALSLAVASDASAQSPPVPLGNPQPVIVNPSPAMVMPGTVVYDNWVGNQWMNCGRVYQTQSCYAAQVYTVRYYTVQRPTCYVQPSCCYTQPTYYYSSSCCEPRHRLFRCC